MTDEAVEKTGPRRGERDPASPGSVAIGDEPPLGPAPLRADIIRPRERVWERVAEHLRDGIREKRWLPGVQIPTEHELSHQLEVNRHTVRRAIAALTADGWLRAEQGRGTFVQEQYLDYALGHRTRFSEIVQASRREPAGRLLRSGEVACNELVAARLELPVSTLCIEIETLHVADGTPLSVATSWFPARGFEGLIPAYEQSGSITRALEAVGIVDYQRRETSITAHSASPKDATVLDQPRAHPVLVAESVNVDATGRRIQFSRTRFASDRVQLSIRF